MFLALALNCFSQTDIIRSGRYIYITANGDTLPQRFTLNDKAVLYGAYIYSLDKTKDVKVLTPSGTFTGTPIDNFIVDSLQTQITNLKKLLNKPKAEIVTIRYSTSKTWLLFNPITNIEFGNGCDSLSRTLKIKSIEDFDFKDVPVILNNAHWRVEKKLLNNGVEITPMDAIRQDLIQTKCQQDNVNIKI